MQIIKSFFIAISMYSKIPVPQFPWKEEDMKYIFCFFPWIGALIGGCIYLWNLVCDLFQVGVVCRTAIDAAIPLLITGGIHVDGFMDTMDSLHSYGSREKKLEILKDSHIGAFAVIMLVTYETLFVGAFSEVREGALLKIVCGGFFLSRCLCGISAVSFPLAKKEGMLFQFSDSSHRKIVKITLYLQSLACVGWMLFWSLPAGLLATAAALCLLGFYYHRSRKEFGGVTGDTSGFFTVLCEGCMVVTAALLHIFLG